MIYHPRKLLTKISLGVLPWWEYKAAVYIARCWGYAENEAFSVNHVKEHLKGKFLSDSSK